MNDRQCKNVKRSPEGFDGQQLNCAVCGYYRFIEGRYYRWVSESAKAAHDAALSANNCVESLTP
jgi:ribosomal protein L37E